MREAEVPQFFIVIESKALRRNKIQIPKEIVRICGDSLTEEACFKLPCGLDWKIALTKSSDGKVWTDKGWPEFSKHYSLAFGHFLVLGYQGNSQFQVTILDKSTIEIDYTSFNKEAKEEPEDDEHVDTLPSPSSTKARKKPRSPQRMSSHQSRGKLNSLRKRSESEKSTPFLSLKAEQNSKALMSVTGFKSNRPSFIRRIEPSHFKPQFSLGIPRVFAISHLERVNKHVRFKVVDRKNKSWPVLCNFNAFYRPTFGSGWKVFAQENAIRIGDVCAFEMIKTTNSIIFEVTIYRENGNADSSLLPGVGLKKTKPVCPKRSARTGKAKMPMLIKSSGEEDPEELLVEKDGTSCQVKKTSKASELASKFRSKHPFFQVDFLSSHLVMYKISLPIWFARIYLGEKTQGLTLRVGKRSWDVQLLYYHSARSAQISRGWTAFVNDNSLRRGDSCIFELIERDQAVFKVSIFRDQAVQDAVKLACSDLEDSLAAV